MGSVEEVKRIMDLARQKISDAMDELNMDATLKQSVDESMKRAEQRAYELSKTHEKTDALGQASADLARELVARNTSEDHQKQIFEALKKAAEEMAHRSDSHEDRLVMALILQTYANAKVTFRILNSGKALGKEDEAQKMADRWTRLSAEAASLSVQAINDSTSAEKMAENFRQAKEDAVASLHRAGQDDLARKVSEFADAGLSKIDELMTLTGQMWAHGLFSKEWEDAARSLSRLAAVMLAQASQTKEGSLRAVKAMEKMADNAADEAEKLMKAGSENLYFQ
uniref:UNC_239 n=1 Tax=synthetic construct TaxID=32630 RepID=UPI0029C1002B|nr:Chain A, UNC_239 [synthetic construct]8TNO_B Chain B, UNC_239 [synthetic construct]